MGNSIITMRGLSGYIALLLFTIFNLHCFYMESSEMEPMDIGRAHYRNYRYEEAADAFEKAVLQDSTNSEAYLLLGTCYAQMDRKSLAIRKLRIAEELNPNYSMAVMDIIKRFDLPEECLPTYR